MKYYPITLIVSFIIGLIVYGASCGIVLFAHKSNSIVYTIGGSIFGLIAIIIGLFPSLLIFVNNFFEENNDKYRKRYNILFATTTTFALLSLLSGIIMLFVTHDDGEVEYKIGYIIFLTGAFGVIFIPGFVAYLKKSSHEILRLKSEQVKDLEEPKETENSENSENKITIVEI